MMAFKSLVAATAALLLFQGANARVARRNGTPAGPFCTDFTPFTYAGCFTDPGSPRALPFSSNISSDAMTTEICVSFCKGNGYRYAGLEYYGECWCGASVQGVQVPDTQCNFPCTGNNSESCGGNSLLTVYQDPTFPVDNISVISDYTASGCWSDSSSSGRALIYRQDALATSTLTVEQCLFSCKAGGYPLAGVEFGSECYCGVVLGNGTTQVASSQCSMPCNGNTAETCGGPALLNLYVATDLESSQPCLNLSPSPPVSSSIPSSTSSTSTTSTSSKPSTTSTSTSVTTPTSSPTTSPTTKPTTPTTAPTTAPTSPPTTTMMTSTTTQTTSSVALCTTTIAPKCEYSCGSWCSNPLPTWSGSSDCETAASNCVLQVAGCFAHAVFPDSLKCFEYSSWCNSVSSYCSSNCARGQCSKGDCISKYPPAGNPGIPTTSVYTCPPTSAPTTTSKPSSKPSSTTCTSVPVPTSSNICQQPNNPGKGYTSNTPCGGIALPCLTCNNIKSDYDAGSCFKLYTNKDTSKCNSYNKPSVSQGCKDACLSQYNSCIGTYAESCKSSWKEKREASANPNWGWGGWGGSWGGGWGGDDYNSASQKCQSQYQDCLSINANVNPGNNRCGSWNSGW